MTLSNLVYVSRARTEMTDSALVDLLEVARSRNEAEQVTGLLVYAQESFMQLLEGDAASIDAIFTSIEQDPRHTDIHVLTRGPTDRRRFAQWWMGFEVTDSRSLALRMPGYQWPARFPLIDGVAVTHPGLAESLLDELAGCR